MYLLDTDICIYLLNRRAPTVIQRLQETPADEVGTTSITAAELRFGALNSGRPRANLLRVEAFLAPLTQQPFENRAAAHYAQIKHHLRTQGQMIGPMDLLIAAVARSIGATLVTNNVREFSRVPGLNIESWLS